MTAPSPDEEIVVRRHWNGTDGAVFRLADVSEYHWSQTSGGQATGLGRVSPRPMVHGYVWCDREYRGELAHSCMHGPPPHRIKVCIVAKDNSRQVMTWVKAQSDLDATDRHAVLYRLPPPVGLPCHARRPGQRMARHGMALTHP